MKCFLLGGAPGTGKTETIWRIYDYLSSKGFTAVAGHPLPPIRPKDFKVIMEGFDNSGRTIKVLVNSATDTEEIIDWVKEFFDEQNGNIDIVISSVRDGIITQSIRQYFFAKMNINCPPDIVVEFPLAKITRRGNDRLPALAWYRETVDELVRHTLSNAPFNI